MPGAMESETRPRAEAILRELGFRARLTVYLASSPGAGKTHRLLEEVCALRHAGIDAVIGWVVTKGRPDLDQLADGIPRIPPRRAELGGATFEDFDLEAALAAHPSVVVLDELAHNNLPGARNAKRWQDALALREAGISVIGALNVQHLETVAPVAERAIGFPIREIVPWSFLRQADQVIAVDAPPDLIEARLRAGAIVPDDDVDRAFAGSFKPQTLQILRELMLRTLSDLTIPVLRPAKVSALLAVLDGEADSSIFVRKCGALADALDLSLEVTTAGEEPREDVERVARTANARVGEPLPLTRGRLDWSQAAATIVAIPAGRLGRDVTTRAVDRDVFIADPIHLRLSGIDPEFEARHPYAQTAGDRLRIGYGKFTVYLGAVAGCGKTYAMLERAHQMRADGIDVVAGLVETHGRPDTIRMLDGLELIPRKDGELDRQAVLNRRPEVALVDELSHTNTPGGEYPKRYEEVLGIVRAGISVITTLNVQHLEGLSDIVLRLTGQRVKETLPDGILELADDVILVDATPETLRDRLRAGKIYPTERIERALTNFFTFENLTALRELAIRETMHARTTAERMPAPFSHLLLGVRSRERDIDLIERCGRLASRLHVDMTVASIVPAAPSAVDPIQQKLAATARRVGAGWRSEVAGDAAAALVALAHENGDAVIVVEGARGRKRLFSPPPFGRRLIDAGATELILFSPAPYQV